MAVRSSVTATKGVQKDRAAEGCSRADRARLTQIDQTILQRFGKANVPCFQLRLSGTVCLLTPLVDNGERKRKARQNSRDLYAVVGRQFSLKAFVGVYDVRTCWQCFSADAPRIRGTTGSGRQAVGPWNDVGGDTRCGEAEW